MCAIWTLPASSFPTHLGPRRTLRAAAPAAAPVAVAVAVAVTVTVAVAVVVAAPLHAALPCLSITRRQQTPSTLHELAAHSLHFNETSSTTKAEQGALRPSNNPPVQAPPRPPSHLPTYAAGAPRRATASQFASLAFASMCTKVVHTYSCGHEVTEKAPCATSRTASCGVCNTKTVKHDEKCDSCDH